MKTHHLLEGKKGIIFGALDENSIAWKVAERAYNEGARFVLSNAPMAVRKGDILRLAEKVEAPVIAADITDLKDLETLFQQAMDLHGELDFILHSVGMSPNVRKQIHYTELNYAYMMKTLDISAISLHKVLATAKKMNALKEWASVVTLTYIGAQRQFSSYSDMSQAKAMLESIVRSFGYHYGIAKKVRINAVSQSPTKTAAGSGVKGFNSFYSYANCMAPLGNADAESCADYCVTLFSDYTRMVTMQTLFHDGGYSNMGISDNLIQNCFQCTKECSE